MSKSAKRVGKRRSADASMSWGAAGSELPTAPNDLCEMPARPERFDFSQQVGHLLRKAYQRNTAIFQELCPDPKLTSVQLAALGAIDVHGPSSLRDIGRAAALDPATTRGVIDRLEERGLVVLAPDASDGRKVIVDLEDEGRKLVRLMNCIRFELSRRSNWCYQRDPQRHRAQGHTPTIVSGAGVQSPPRRTVQKAPDWLCRRRCSQGCVSPRSTGLRSDPTRVHQVSRTVERASSLSMVP